MRRNLQEGQGLDHLLQKRFMSLIKPPEETPTKRGPMRNNIEGPEKHKKEDTITETVMSADTATMITVGAGKKTQEGEKETMTGEGTGLPTIATSLPKKI